MESDSSCSAPRNRCTRKYDSRLARSTRCSRCCARNSTTSSSMCRGPLQRLTGARSILLISASSSPTRRCARCAGIRAVRTDKAPTPLVEGQEMRATGFGRRIIESDARELVLVPQREDAAADPTARTGNLTREDIKERVRSILMSRIDPAVAGRIPRRTLRAEIALLVSAIASEEKVQLNEVEEAAL